MAERLAKVLEKLAEEGKLQSNPHCFGKQSNYSKETPAQQPA